MGVNQPSDRCNAPAEIVQCGYGDSAPRRSAMRRLNHLTAQTATMCWRRDGRGMSRRRTDGFSTVFYSKLRERATPYRTGRGVPCEGLHISEKWPARRDVQSMRSHILFKRL